jgi:hypothetical protein
LSPATLAAQAPPQSSVAFVGSKTCATCHQSIYDRWQQTRMANVLVDVKEHPEAIIGDFSQPNPLVTFKKEEIAFTYGSKWKQRYFTRIGDRGEHATCQRRHSEACAVFVAPSAGSRDRQCWSSTEVAGLTLATPR